MRSSRLIASGAAVLAPLLVMYGVVQAEAPESPPQIDPNGTIHVPAFSLPESSILSSASRAELARERVPSLDAFTTAVSACQSMQTAQLNQLPGIRECQVRAFQSTPFYRHLRVRYPVTVTPQKIGGVPTEVFLPEEGVASKNKGRVLINLHGGSFSGGSRTNSQVESIPIAFVGRVKVISVDYRLAPEHTFPAATEDVVAVYREILRHYAPRNVGLYGCSAGGALSAQVIAWLSKHELPLPGAVGLFCYGAGRALDATHERWVHSDSAYFVGALTGTYQDLLRPQSYYRGLNVQDSLINPGDYDDILARFPPTLLISSTRDYLLSSVVSTHAQLTRLGVTADLHVWEGMQHAFFYYPDLPESAEAYAVIAHFFDRHLGQ